jgi:hypothetical protein
MKTKRINHPHTELINNFNSKSKVQDKLGKLEDYNYHSNISCYEQFLYKFIGSYFVSFSKPDFRRVYTAGWSNHFKNVYTEQLQDLSKLGADMSNYPKELKELLN